MSIKHLTDTSWRPSFLHSNSIKILSAAVVFLKNCKQDKTFKDVISDFLPLCSRVPEPSQTASVDAGARSGHRVCSAHGPGPVRFLLLRQNRQLFALALVQ
ncbi:hypothetical protein XENOCAPTIV_018697, partial [Xenoophorus captivus]